MKFEEAIKAAAEVSRKDGESCDLIFDGCETKLTVSAYQDYEDVYVCLRGEEQFNDGYCLFTLLDVKSDKCQV